MIIDMSEKNMEQQENGGAFEEIGKTLKDLVKTHRTLMGVIKQIQNMLNSEIDDIDIQKVAYEATIKAITKEDSNFANAIETLGNDLIELDKKVKKDNE